MNEFSAKKLGEILAFAKVGNEILTKTEHTLEEVFPKEVISHLIISSQGHIDKIKEFAISEKVDSIAFPKSEKTSSTLRKMSELYIGDKWDVATELLEWHGFFEGAAIVHYNLVLGTAISEKNDALMLLALKGLKFHEDFLLSISEKLKEVGIQKNKK